VTGVALEGWPTTGDSGENFVFLGGQQEAAALVPLGCVMGPGGCPNAAVSASPDGSGPDSKDAAGGRRCLVAVSDRTSTGSAGLRGDQDCGDPAPASRRGGEGAQNERPIGDPRLPTSIGRGEESASLNRDHPAEMGGRRGNLSVDTPEDLGPPLYRCAGRPSSYRA